MPLALRVNRVQFHGTEWRGGGGRGDDARSSLTSKKAHQIAHIDRILVVVVISVNRSGNQKTRKCRFRKKDVNFN